MALDLGTLVAKVKVDDDDFDKKTDSWSKKGAGIASAFGNVAADAISQATNMLVDFVGDAAAASDATDKFKKTLEFSGLDTSKIDTLTASTQAYADATVYSLGDIQNITAQLASNGVQGPDELAKALGNLNAVAGGNAETFGRVGSVLTQTTSLGALNTENWRQMAEAIPGASGALKDALLQAGAYTGNFEQALSEGQITAEEFNAALMTVGTDPIAVEAAKSTETFEGAAGNLSATIQGKLVEALNLVKGPITDFQKGLADFIDNIEEWTPLLAGLGAVILAALAPAIWAMVVATWAWTAALLANPITWIVLGIGALVAAIVWLIMNWDTAVAWISEVWGGFITWITGVIDGFVGWWNGVWSAVGQWISDVWSGFTSWIQDVWNGFVSFLMAALIGYLSFWIGIWNAVRDGVTAVWEAVVSWVSSVVSGFVGWLSSVWNGFVSFWSGLWSGVQSTVENVWNGIVSFFEGIPDTILGFFEGAGEWLLDVGESIIQGLIDGINNMVGAVGDAIGGVLDWAAGFFPHSPAKRGPFSGSGWYAIGAAGEAIVAAFAAGLDDDAAISAELNQMMSVSPSRDWASAESGGAQNVKNITVQMFEPQHPDTEEALYHALGSPRVRD